VSLLGNYDYKNLITNHARWHTNLLMGLHSLPIRLTHLILDTQDPSLLGSTLAPVTTSSNIGFKPMKVKCCLSVNSKNVSHGWSKYSWY
jgi:hypothetical protein